MAEKTYIDGELLLEKLSDLKFANAAEDHCTEFRTIDKIMRMVLSMPLADVRENVRGEWIPFDEYTYLCSNCSWVDAYRVSASVKVGFPFCPRCGADMRGESNA